MKYWIWFLPIIFISTGLFAQQQQQNQQGEPEVIEIEARIIDARAELPQVQILDRRKQVEFDEVKVEKSFKTELTGETEKVEIVLTESKRIKPIKNLDALLKKKRF